MSLIRRTYAVIICLALVAVIAVLASAILHTNRLDNAAQELAIAATREAFEAGYPAALIENSHPDYQAIFPPEDLLRYLESSKRRLGPLISLVAIRGSAELSRIPYGQAANSAEFEIDLDFQNTPASVNIRMKTVDGRWLITAFRLSAQLLGN